MPFKQVSCVDNLDVFEATYLSEAGHRYEVGFMRSFHEDFGFEMRELQWAREGQRHIRKNQPIWSEIQGYLEQGWYDPEDVFVIRLPKRGRGCLEKVIAQVRSEKQSPEQVLLISVLGQIKRVCDKRK